MIGLTYINEKGIKTSYEGYYIDMEGNYYSDKYGYLRQLKPHKLNNGYNQALITINGKSIGLLLQRCVLSSFNPDGYFLNAQANHRNQIRNDNRLENLEWVSVIDNNNYADRGEQIRNNKINGTKSKQVLQYDFYGNLLKEWPSIGEIERQLGYINGNISRCCSGKRKQAYGYLWKYKETV